MPQGISGPGASGNVNGPASSTDNALVRWDGATGTIIQDSNGILDDNGDLIINQVANSEDAFQLLDDTSQEIIKMDSRRPDIAGNMSCLQVTPNANNGFPGSGAFIRGIRVRMSIDSGTQTGAARGVDAIVRFEGNANLTGDNIARGFNSNVVWNSSGTASTVVGIQNFMAFSGGGASNATGLVTEAICNRAAVGVNTSLSGSLTDGISYQADTPIRVDATTPITNVYGFKAEDQTVTGATTNTWGLKVEDQTSPGMAIETGTGLIELGDQVFINGSQDIIQLLVQGNATQTSDILVIEQSDGTDLLTIDNDGLTQHNVRTDNSSAFTIQNAATANIIRVNSEAPSAYAGASDALFNAFHSFAGSGKTPYGVFGGLTISSGDQTAGTASIYGRTYFTSTAASSSNVQRGGLFLTHWQASGTAANLIGLDNQVIQGIDTQGAGTVALGYGQRTVVGFLAGSLASAYTTTVSNFIRTPNNTDATHTITTNTGLLIEDQNPTGVTNAFGIDIEDQSSGGYAIRTGTGIHLFGDKVSISQVDDMTINGSSTTTKFEVHHTGDGTDSEIEMHRHNDTSAVGVIIYGARSRGTHTTPTVVQADDTLVTFAAVGYDGTDYGLSSRIDLEVDGTPGNNDMPGRIVFKTSLDGGQSPAEALRIDSSQSTILSGRLQGAKGTDVASADEITLGTDGNYFDITGTTTINHINNTDWQAGSVVILQFDASVTVTHNAGSPTGTEADILLAGAANFPATANDTLTLVYDGVTFRETARTVI